jgi:hypothetical protein
MFVTRAQADPLLLVTPRGVDATGNRNWLVEIKPEPALFQDRPHDVPDMGLGSPMAVELAFAIDFTDLLSISANTVDWDFANPGHNPFTGTITDGLWVDMIGDRTFGAFGSRIFYSGDPVELFKIQTQGSGLARIRWGQAASGHPTHGSIIAQLGGTFQTPPGELTLFEFNVSGALAVPEPTCAALAAFSALAVVYFASRCRRF